MKKYKEFQYAIKPTRNGQFYGIVYTPDGKDLFYRTEKHLTEYQVYVELTNRVEEFLKKSEQP
jgi:hypothetical protein